MLYNITEYVVRHSQGNVFFTRNNDLACIGEHFRVHPEELEPTAEDHPSESGHLLAVSTAAPKLPQYDSPAFLSCIVFERRPSEMLMKRC